MVTDFSSSQFRKGHSTQKPPLFDGSNYNYWKCRMKIYLQSINYKIWNIIEAAYEKSRTNYDQWTKEQKKSVNLGAKAMNAFSVHWIKKNTIVCQQSHQYIKFGIHYRWHMKVQTKLSNLKFLFLCTGLNYSK